MSDERPSTPTLEEIVVYPVKSLRGIAVPEWEVVTTGLAWDRHWMLVDESGEFMTQRKTRALALFDVAFEPDGLRVSRAADSLHIPLAASGACFPAKVWDDEVEVQEVAPEISAWFSARLDTGCRLVAIRGDRPLKAPGAQPGEGIAFTDSNPVLVASRSAIELLNSKLAAPIPIRRFRPNFVIADCLAHAEDEWPGIEVGGATLRASMKCRRCLVTTIDIETAQTSDEPLRTLHGYRRDGRHVAFGAYFVPERVGRIAVGDPLTISRP